MEGKRTSISSTSAATASDSRRCICERREIVDCGKLFVIVLNRTYREYVQVNFVSNFEIRQ